MYAPPRAVSTARRPRPSGCTNVLVRLLTRDDEEQTAAAEAFVAAGAWISHVVLVETVWVLESVYDVDARGRAKAIEMLLSHRELTMQDPDVVARALAHFRKRPSLGFSDCLVLECARKAGHGRLGTFDREMGRVEGVVVVGTGHRGGGGT